MQLLVNIGIGSSHARTLKSKHPPHTTRWTLFTPGMAFRVGVISFSTLCAFWSDALSSSADLAIKAPCKQEKYETECSPTKFNYSIRTPFHAPFTRNRVELHSVCNRNHLNLSCTKNTSQKKLNGQTVVADVTWRAWRVGMAPLRPLTDGSTYAVVDASAQKMARNFILKSRR